ncbi:hypothetical protein [Pseudanabaena sp. FACHB-2040]|uniref:hypothetical protein n=1 Tax=Pseudanabaena sp. FACHB-2040 TaxID=2692859 RepID=UPI00168730F4|nr:hypothetical protein [Pseudanabaena sp. FACHB-2040]MBD2260096.1 hypothetical protein [Pseudanabaena sp. FACHB-2040]
MPEQSEQQSNSSSESERGVRVSAEQEMLSSTDQVDLDTTMSSMNIPIENEDSLDSEDSDSSQS